MSGKKTDVLIALQHFSGADLKNLDVKVNALVHFLGALWSVGNGSWGNVFFIGQKVFWLEMRPSLIEAQKCINIESLMAAANCWCVKVGLLQNPPHLINQSFYCANSGAIGIAAVGHH